MHDIRLNKFHYDSFGLSNIIYSKASLSLMNREIENLTPHDKKGLLEAYENCAELSKSDKHKLMFLRCEQFNVDVSFQQIVNFLIH